MNTNVRPKDINREWHLVDAKDKVLGRLASDVAQILLGKNKNYFTPHLDTGDYVVVINAQKVNLTGKKEKQKFYHHHSNYPGGLYTKTSSDLRKQKPTELITHAVTGMLPKTKLGKIMIKKMYVYLDNNHPHADKFVTTEIAGKKT